MLIGVTEFSEVSPCFMQRQLPVRSLFFTLLRLHITAFMLLASSLLTRRGLNYWSWLIVVNSLGGTADPHRLEADIGLERET